MSEPRWRPAHAHVIVKRWTNPEQADGTLIVLPESYLMDRTMTLFEVVDSGPCVELPCRYCRAIEEDMIRLSERTQGQHIHQPFRGLGMKLQADDLLTLRFGWSALSLQEVLGEDLWVLHARSIASVERWKSAPVD